MAEPHDRKPILTIEQQIEHLKQKGVAFELCSEEEAADYLRDKCNFFKLASYRKLFSKYEGGPRDGRYVDLDFGQLRLLAALDQELRHALLGMTLDIEHFQKVTLLREMEDRGEDGYAIVADYMASLTAAAVSTKARQASRVGRPISFANVACRAPARRRMFDRRMTASEFMPASTRLSASPTLNARVCWSISARRGLSSVMVMKAPFW